MSRTWAVLLAASLILGGCAQVRESRFNPFNWFSRAPQIETTDPDVNPLIPVGQRGIFAASQEVYAGTTIEVVSQARLDPTPGGAILLVYGSSAVLGGYDVRLVPDESTIGERVLAYDMQLLLPESPRPGPQSIVAARTLSKQDLAGIREILIRGSQQSRVVRPR